MATAPMTATPASATQPSASIVLQAPEMKPDGLRRLGAMLATRFTEYETDRRLAELKWARNSRQYLGIYDPEVESSIPKERSRAYPKVTRVKCVSMLSRLMNLLFQADDKNWAVAASAVPNLSQEDLQTVLDSVMPPPSQDQTMSAPSAMPGPRPAAPSSDVIEQAIRDFAKKRADRLELEIEDQLQELGGSRSVDYVALCRKVLASGIQYGAGILKGPFVEEQEQRQWDQDASGRMVAQQVTAYRPRFEFVPIWDYYPDMSAKSLAQMDGQFQRIVMSRHQVSLLKQRPDFLADQIDVAIKQNPGGNYRRRAFETELRADGVQNNVNDTGRNKFEAIMWEGFVSGKELQACGLTITDDQVGQDLRAQVWTIGNLVVKAALDPWSQLETDGDMKQFHHFIFEEDETFILGNALPNIMRDSQMGVCAATRMAIDNGSVQRVFEVNTTLLSPNQDLTAITPDMVIYRDDESISTVGVPAVRAIEIPMQLDKYQGLVKMFQDFADQETFVSAGTGGDMQKGPSEPFRTATGASMLRGDAALPFKDVVRNYDMFTESVIGAIINFNRNFNTNSEIRGDFKPVARGATSLIAKEVLGIQLDNLAQTLTDQEKQYVKFRNLVRERVRVRDLQVENIVMNDAECDAVDANVSAQQQAQSDMQNQMAQAEIRDTMSKTLKNASQADKNTAASQATTAGVVLDGMEKGLDPKNLIGAVSGESNTTQPPAGGPGTARPGAGAPGGLGNAGIQAPAIGPGAGAGRETAAMPAS